MTTDRSRRADAGGPGDDAREAHPGNPILPYGRAFVVQFTLDSETARGRVAGRVEHLKTGGRSWFTSIDGLLASMTELLGELPRGRRERRQTTRPSSSRRPRRGGKARHAR